jgi:hypothetical protein
VPAYVLIPDTYDGSTRYPALVCQHGHGNRVQGRGVLHTPAGARAGTAGYR